MASPHSGAEDRLQEVVRDLAGDGRRWAAQGVISAIDDHPRWGVVATVTEQPSGREGIVARLLWPGGVGAGLGLFVPPAVGAEVLLFFPDGDTNRAIAIAGLTGGSRRLPSSYDGEHIDVVHGGGVEVRTTEAAPVQPVVQATTFQSDLKDFLGALNTFMTGALAVVQGWQVPPLAAAFQADPRVTTFVGRATSGFYSTAALKSE